MTALSIVIPAFNEEHRIDGTLATLRDGLDHVIGPNWEVVVCDDGSSDGTAAIVAEHCRSEPRIRMISEGANCGKGAAMAAGFRSATAAWVLLLDADLPVPLGTITDLLDGAGDSDVVAGSRRRPGSTFTTPQPALRRLGGSVFLAVVDLLGFGGDSDPQCGVKLLRRESLEPIIAEMRLSRFGFDVELLTRCRQGGLHVEERPVTWTHVPGSTLRPVRDAVVTLADLVRLRRELRAGSKRDLARSR